MNPLILNRQGRLPEDGWYEIEAAGDHYNQEAGVVQRLDPAAFTAIVNRFAAAAAKPNFAGLLVDQDHFSLDTTKSSEAYGWLKELRNRDGHLEGRIEWTDLGQGAVEKQRYKFFSTVYDAAPVERVGEQMIKNRKVPIVRPLVLDRLALTNDPNNKGGKPISNREANPGAAAENKTTMKSVLKLLGLADDASEESAASAVQKIQNRATTAEGQVTTLTKERDTLLGAQVEADLEKYKNRFKPENREKIKAALIRNRASTIELLEATEPAAAADTKAPRITNRQAAATPETGGGSNDEEGKLAARISNRALQIQKEKSGRGRVYPYQSAFNDAKAELGSSK